MRRDELKLTGKSYRLTPSSWGESFVMIDEGVVSKMVSDCFEEKYSPDDDPNDTPEEVEIAKDENGNFYAILVPHEGTSWGTKTGEMFNENLFRPITNPEKSVDGAAEFLNNSWELFD